MIKGIYTAAAGMLPRMDQQETVGNNLANVNTTGYKASKRYFRTTLNSHLLQGGSQGQPIKQTDDQYSLFTDFSQGTLNETRNPLDVAINGEGFFVVQSGDTVAYSRNGNFMVNENGELVNNRGHLVLGEEGPIITDGKDVRIRADGTVLVDNKVVGTIKIVNFEKLYQMKKVGWGYYLPEPPQEPISPEKIDLRQGYLENSNVDPVYEMILMIELNRNYESCQKAIHAQDETLKLTVNELGK